MTRALKRGVGIASVLLAVGACSSAGPDEKALEPIGTAQSAWGPAANGNITIALPTVVNKYANVTNDLAVGGTSITVGNIADLGPPAVGDLVMVMQMQGATINATNTDQYGNVTDRKSVV